MILDASPSWDGSGPDESGVHSHAEAIVAWSDGATAIVSCGGRDWVVSPGHGMWIPAGAPHAVQVLRSGTGNALVFPAGGSTIAPTEPTAVRITPLLRELVVHLHRLDGAAPGVRQRAEALLQDLLEPVPATTVPLPIPTDDRLRGITDALIKDPADDRDLAQWAFDVGAGTRTVSRLFVAQTGLTFAQWRTRARIRAAIALLATGTPVGTVGRRVGFTRPAAFSEAFRRVTGHRPTAFHAATGLAGAAPSTVDVRAGS